MLGGVSHTLRVESARSQNVSFDNYSKATAGLLMLKFLGIGAQKCGTTWLYHALSRHPSVAFPGGKEVHFWDVHRARGLAWYSDIFSDATRTNGDITPAYSFLPLDVIREVGAFAPDLRLIYMIRDPRERAWSSARMALARAEMTHEEASDEWFIDHFRSSGSLGRGDYESCIRNWRSVFGAERLLVVRYESLAEDAVAVANCCLAHLGVSGARFGEEDRAVLQERKFEGDGVPLRPSLRRILDALYSERVSSLGRYLGEDFSAWQS